MIYPGSAPASSPDLGHSAASVSSGHQPQAPSGHQGMMLAEGLGLASLGGQAAAYSAHNGHNLEKSVRIAHLYYLKMSQSSSHYLITPCSSMCECQYFVCFTPLTKSPL